MKNIIRFSVAALVLTGVIASTQANASTKATTVQPKISAMPVPICEPDGSTSCGI